MNEIQAWKKQEPSVVSQAIGGAMAPLSWVVQKVIPAAVFEGALESASWLGYRLADYEDLLKAAGIRDLEDLRKADLRGCDNLADQVHNWAIGLGAAEGAATGLGGIMTLPLDIPVIITLAMRTIHKIGMCYEYESKNPSDGEFVRGIVAAAAANTQQEKYTALAVLRAAQVTLMKQTWKKMAEKAAGSGFTKEAVITSIRALAKQLGINLTKREALVSIPFIGMLIDGPINGWFIRDVGWAARRSFQERWLRDNGKFVDTAP